MNSSFKIVLRILNGVAVFLAIVALFMLGIGAWGVFFGALIISLFFFAFSWTGRRMFLPAKNENPRQSVSLIIAVIFGGAGGLMLIGSIWLLVEGESGGAAGLFIFGLVFGLVAYFGSRLFAPPKGKKEIMVGTGTGDFGGVMGQSGQISEESYIYVDEKIPEAEIKRMKQQWVDKPWTQREDWAAGKVVQEGTGSLGLLVGFTVIWNMIACSIAGFGILDEWGQSDFPWFLFLFPAVGLALVIWTVLIWRRKRKFGSSVLDLKTVPAYLGDWLRGTVHTGVKVKNETGKEFRIKLVCAQRTSTLDSEGDRRVSEKEIWSMEQKVFGSVAASGETFDVQINMTVPGHLPPTVLHPEDERYLWRLKISAGLKGVDYASHFEVPVYSKDKAKE